MVAILVGLGGPGPALEGGWDWWILLCVPLAFTVARRIVGLSMSFVTAGIALGVGTVLSDLIRAWGVAPAAAFGIVLTAVALLVRGSLPERPPSV